MMPTPLRKRATDAACGLKTKKILLVEDDPDLAEYLCDRLREHGFVPRHLAEGENVMYWASRERPALILMDVRLPGVDGLTVCELLADYDETRDIPVIILSGLDRADVVHQSRAVGARYFLRKPYDPEVLLLLIQSALTIAEAW